MVFEQAFATASWTRPSVASLLTGLDARKHGAVHSDEGLGTVETLAENLARAGYRTQAWITNPFLKGGGFERGFERYEKLCLGRGFDVTGREVTAMVRAQAAVGPATFNWIHFIDPHDPYRPSEEARAQLVRPYAGTASGETRFVRGALLTGEFVSERRRRRNTSPISTMPSYGPWIRRWGSSSIGCAAPGPTIAPS